MNNNAPFDDIPPEYLAVFIGILIVLMIVGLVVYIFFLMTLSKTIYQVALRNREMEPGQVWLNLIPCLNIVWIFITVTRIAESLQKEFRDRGYPTRDENFGKSMGMAYAILAICGGIPIIGGVFGIAALVCWIIYWVQIAGYGKRLEEEGSGRPFDDADERGPGDDPRRGLNEPGRGNDEPDDRFRSDQRDDRFR